MATTNGFSGRRQRISSLRGSPEKDASVELQVAARLRDRGSEKNGFGRSKRRRGDRLAQGSVRDGRGGGEVECVNDEEEELQRKSLPRGCYRVSPRWKVPSGELIGLSVPRKARSVCSKRSNEQVFRRISESPNPNGAIQRPPKVHSNPSSSNQDEIEFEIAEVLYGLRQNQNPPKQERNDFVKFDLREMNKSCRIYQKNKSCSGDAKFRVSSPVPNSRSSQPQSSTILPRNSSSSAVPLTAIFSESKPSIMAMEEAPSSGKEKLSDLRFEVNLENAVTATKANSTICKTENQREERFQIGRMKDGEISGKDGVAVEPEEKKVDRVVEETDSQKSLVNKDLQQQPKLARDELNTEKTVQLSNCLLLPMSVASWTSGIPPMGYMGPLQGVVPRDGAPVPSVTIQPDHSVFSQPKRGATHCYIARYISYNQQFARMNSFQSAVSGSSPVCGKPSNLNVVAAPPSYILLQAMAATTASAQSGTVKSPTPGNAASSSVTNSATISSGPAASATAMSFTFPAMPANESQYLAMLQNMLYPFPIPARQRPTALQGNTCSAHSFVQQFFLFFSDATSFTTANATSSSGHEYFQWLIVFTEKFAESAATTAA